MKKDAWASIEKEFNSQIIHNHRTAIILKTKYENIKRNVKKQYAAEKSFSRGTGGGPVKQFYETSIAATVGDILKNKLTGESLYYDSDNYDTFEHEQVKNEAISCRNESDDMDIVTITDFSEIINDDDTGKCVTEG